MAVLVQKGKPPEGAVKLSDAEATNMQWKLIQTWKPASDVWPFRYGIASLAVSTTISAMMIVTHFRRKLKLKSIGHLAMYLPTVVIPTLALAPVHTKLVTEPILLQTECPVCIQLRSIFIQNAVGLLYPLILTPISGFMIASVNATYPVPELSIKNIGNFLTTYRTIIRPFSNRLLGLSLVNTFLALAVTEGQARSMFKVQRVLRDELYGVTTEMQNEKLNTEEI